MKPPLHDACAAAIPAGAFALLAPLRCEPGVKVLVAGDTIWIRWQPGSEAPLWTVTAIPGSTLFVQRGTQWFPLNKHLPVDIPAEGFRPLDQVLFPAPVQPLAVSSVEVKPLTLHLAADEQPRPATALRGVRADLVTWMDTVTNVRLSRLEACFHEKEVLILGERLPEISQARRYWGQTVLAPLGYRAEPALGERGLREILGLKPDELAFLDEERVDIVARQAFGALSRGGVRQSFSGGRG